MRIPAWRFLVEKNMRVGIGFPARTIAWFILHDVTIRHNTVRSSQFVTADAGASPLS